MSLATRISDLATAIGNNIRDVTARVATLEGQPAGIPDAPSDGNVYARQDGAWVVVGEVAPTLSAPVNTAAPVISGATPVGSVLTTTDGTWDGNPAPTFTYQWYADNVAITGATNNTFTTTSAEAEASVECRVTATNSEGSATMDSNNIVIDAAGGGGGTPGIFGTQLTNGTGNWGSNPNRAMFDKFTLTNTATLVALNQAIHAGSPGGNSIKGVICADDNAGAPGTVLVVGAPVLDPGNASLQYLRSVFAGEVLSPGDYWIGAVSDGGDAGMSEFASGAHTNPNAVLINGDFNYANPPAVCPAPAANYANDLACYVEYTY